MPESLTVSGVCSLNVLWLVCHADCALHCPDPEQAGYHFDIAVFGGIVFG